MNTHKNFGNLISNHRFAFKKPAVSKVPGDKKVKEAIAPIGGPKDEISDFDKMIDEAARRGEIEKERAKKSQKKARKSARQKKYLEDEKLDTEQDMQEKLNRLKEMARKNPALRNKVAKFEEEMANRKTREQDELLNKIKKEEMAKIREERARKKEHAGAKAELEALDADETNAEEMAIKRMEEELKRREEAKVAALKRRARGQS